MVVQLMSPQSWTDLHVHMLAIRVGTNVDSKLRLRVHVENALKHCCVWKPSDSQL